MMGERNHRGGTFLLVLLLSTFILDCAPAPAATSYHLSENKVYFREPLSIRFPPKTFSIFPAVPQKTIPSAVADIKEPVADGKLVAGDQLPVPVGEGQEVPVGGLQEDIIVGGKPEEGVEQLEDVDHSSPVVANVVESLNQTINKIELNQLSTEGVRKIFSEIISAVSKLVPEDLSSTSGGPAIAAAEVGSDAVQNENGGFEFEKHEVKKDEHKKEVELDLVENEKEVEIDLADGLSIFAGWPNICKLLWYGNNFSDHNHRPRPNCYPPTETFAMVSLQFISDFDWVIGDNANCQHKFHSMLTTMLRWPIHKEKCGETRCVTCGPALMAAAQV